MGEFRGLSVCAVEFQNQRLKTIYLCSADFFLEEGFDLFDVDAFLRAGVAVADGYGVVFEGVAVDGETEGGAGFIHACVAFTDVLFDIHLDGEFGSELAVEFFRDFGHAIFLDEWEDRCLDRCKSGVEAHEHFAWA